MPSIIRATTTSGLQVAPDNSGSLQLQTNGTTTAMTIDTSQNVGIGTASPTTKLTVGSLTDANNTLQVNASGSGVSRTVVNSNGSQAAEFAVNFSGSTDTFGVVNNAVGLHTLNSATPLTFGTNATERMRIDSTGNVSIIQTPGKYTVDTTGGATSIANGGTVDFPNASGMLVVNNWTTGGVSIYLFGGGSTAIIGSVVGAVGTTAYNSGVGGYRWTNNTGSTATFGFFFVRTRQTA